MDDSISAAIDRMQAAMEAEMLPLMLDVGEHVAAEARSGHTYTNRTGRLEASTRHGAASGRWRTGYRVDVVARRPYASYVDEGTGDHTTASGAERAGNRAYPYLLPAWRRSEEWAEREVERVLINAIVATP